MKKVLFATTALVLSAGVAAADVSFSGDARVGLQYNSNPNINDNNMGAGATRKTQLERRTQFNLDGRTTTDGGVTLGIRIRSRSNENANGGVGGGLTSFAGARIFAQFGGLTVAAGNILGAIESMPGTYTTAAYSLTGLSWGGVVHNVDRGNAGAISGGGGFFNWAATSADGTGVDGVEVIYTMGDFTVHASHDSAALAGFAGNQKRTAVYGSYRFSGWTVALAVQDSNVAAQDKVALTVGGRIGDFNVGFQAARNGSGNTKINKFVVNGSYTMGAIMVGGYIANQGTPQGALPANFSRTSYGLGASYNLGGGARVVGGIERTTRKTTRADLGVAFAF